ncbi:putative serine/threonine-protein kinase, active [Septoria linicola]|nr:putative serine/threonine-protein kinase, active [Septoria linicola]
MPWSTERDLPCEAAILLEHLHAHPKIIAIFDSLPDLRAPGRHRVFMEYCSAGSLAEQYTHWGSALKKPMPEIFLLHVLVQGCEALAFIHRGLRYAGRGQYTQDLHYQPIIHGDVKEDNFLLHWDYFPLPEIKLADFGNAKLAHAKDSRIQPGTLCFHAPEDVAIYGDLQRIPENARAFDEMIDRRTIASDMYAFGLMMYMFATCDRYPVKIGTDPRTMRISREYRTPGLLELIKKMLGIDPAERAEASFVPPNGVLAQVHEMRTARDMLLGARENPKGEEWFVLAPKGHHAG